MLTAQKAVAQIQAHAEEIKSDKLQRFPEAASPGDSCRQGDVYITLLDRLPAGATKMAVELQIAPGTTQGSRHCLDAKAGVETFILPNPGMLDGPVIRLTKPRTIRHPEHGWWRLPAGIYQISFQRNLDSEEREQRVLD